MKRRKQRPKKPRNSFVMLSRPWRRATAVTAISVTAALFLSACGGSHGETETGHAESATQSAMPTPTPKATYEPIGDAGDWKLVFDDEFNGSKLDTAKWSTG